MPIIKYCSASKYAGTTHWQPLINTLFWVAAQARDAVIPGHRIIGTEVPDTALSQKIQDICIYDNTYNSRVCNFPSPDEWSYRAEKGVHAAGGVVIRMNLIYGLAWPKHRFILK